MAFSWCSLPLRVQGSIAAHLAAESHGSHLLSKYASVSRSWQAYYERLNFREIRIGIDDLGSFAVFLMGARRRYLKRLTFSPGFCRTQGHKMREVVLTQDLWNLFALLSIWRPEESRGLDFELQLHCEGVKENANLDFQLESLPPPARRHGRLKDVKVITRLCIPPCDSNPISSNAVYSFCSSLPRLECLDVEQRLVGVRIPEQGFFLGPQRKGNLSLAPPILLPQPVFSQRLKQIQVIELPGECQTMEQYSAREDDIRNIDEIRDEIGDGICRKIDSSWNELRQYWNRVQHQFFQETPVPEEEHIEPQPSEDEEKFERPQPIDQDVCRFFTTFCLDSDGNPLPSNAWPDVESVTFAHVTDCPFSDSMSWTDLYYNSWGTGTVNRALLEASAAVRRMPRLRLMQILVRLENGAAYFRYEVMPASKGKPSSAVAAWTGSWDVNIVKTVREAWEEVAQAHGHDFSFRVTCVALPQIPGVQELGRAGSDRPDSDLGYEGLNDAKQSTISKSFEQLERSEDDLTSPEVVEEPKDDSTCAEVLEESEDVAEESIISKAVEESEDSEDDLTSIEVVEESKDGLTAIEVVEESEDDWEIV